MSAEQRVREMLETAQRIAQDVRGGEISEALLIEVFHQLRIEIDLQGPEPEEETVFPAVIH